MPFIMPPLYEEARTRTMLDTFGGYNHNLRIGEGEFYDMMNLCSDDYPVLSVRPPRGTAPAELSSHAADAVSPECLTVVTPEGTPQGEEKLCYIDGNTLVVGDVKIDFTKKEGARRSMVRMGAYVVIVPDMYYVNTIDVADRGYIEDEWGGNDPEQWTLYVADYEGKMSRFDQEKDPCRYGMMGAAYETPITLPNGTLWFRTGGTPTLFRHDADTGEWVETDCYTWVLAKEACISLRRELRPGDTVRLGNMPVEDMDGVYQIVKTRCIEHSGEWRVWMFLIRMTPSSTYPLRGVPSISRVIPKMDLVCESGNRLWGCRYGDDGHGNFVNEIYCSARGDFFRWCLGDADDLDAPVTFSVASDGPFTAAVEYGGYPTFFKERVMHRVSGTFPSNYAVYTDEVRGVMGGCERSVRVIDGVLYYKARSAVMAYDGSQAVVLSQKLGELSDFGEAVGGVYQSRYYISMKHRGSGESRLFVLDTARGLWYREDDVCMESAAEEAKNLYYIAADDSGKRAICAIRGDRDAADADSHTAWYAESGLIGLETPDLKYISRLAIRLHMSAGAFARALIQYDSCGEWEPVMTYETPNMRTVTVPLILRRCDHMRLRLEGQGACKILSITKTMENGGDG